VTPGTFDYDGGPRVPVPLPPGEETMTNFPRRPALIDDLLVSTKATSGRWNYPAYGEKPTRTPTYTVRPSVISATLK
jgi:hypothetical protein